MTLPKEINLDGCYDDIHNGRNDTSIIEYIGKAVLQDNGKYKVLAKINNTILAVVEVKVKLSFNE